MQTIEKDELFRNLGDFLKSKGIELGDGSYATRIQQGCNLLSDAINATQETVSKAKGKVDQALDQLRQTIHEHTAPKPRASGETPSSKTRAKRRATRPAKQSATKTTGARRKPVRRRG
jgi:hypothetical protein